MQHLDPGHTSAIKMVIQPRIADLGDFSVRRLLPVKERKTIGPWIFFDEMGPAEFAPGSGINVRPHPHIGLATVTYLFQGEILHRDSLGSLQLIQPGDINLMVAGKGIVHSERERPQVTATAHSLHGLQLWLALPEADAHALQLSVLVARAGLQPFQALRGGLAAGAPGGQATAVDQAHHHADQRDAIGNAVVDAGNQR